MKTIFLAIGLLCTISLISQEKGVSPISGKSGGKTGQTRAVIIGISDYRDDHIPDLHFAHKDAEAFATYLQSPAGGELPEENMYLLTNEKATTGQMYAALDWLIEESPAGRPGDHLFQRPWRCGNGDPPPAGLPADPRFPAQQLPGRGICPRIPARRD